jgi:hypothetical protein
VNANGKLFLRALFFLLPFDPLMAFFFVVLVSFFLVVHDFLVSVACRSRLVG